MAEKNIKGKVAVVTGGTRGIGRAIVERLLKEGVRVAFCGTSQKTVDDAGRRLREMGDVLGSVADISKLPEVKGFIAAVMERFGTIDILVNNAGVGIFAKVAALEPAQWERMIGLNLSGTYYCCHEVLPIFQTGGGGDVLNISSLAGKNAFASGGGYNATKFGLNGFSEAMMLDHRNDGVRVSYIMPGSVDTEFGGGTPDSVSAWKIAPEDIADIVVAILRMPGRTTVSRVEIRPSRPPQKA
jgi:3-oxoacyl-[acyl-carrier protein] reductase